MTAPAGCCRQTAACPAHATGDCTWTPPAVQIAGDPAVIALLDALSPDWRDQLAQRAAAAPLDPAPEA